MISWEELASSGVHPNVKAFLRVIRAGESNQNDDAYRLISGGEHFEAPPWVHPYEGQSAPPGKAAGAPQFIPHTWGGLVKQYGFEDFSPSNQDSAAVALIAEHGALDDVKAGNLDEAIRKLAATWVSLPGLGARAQQVFEQYGGTLEAPAPIAMLVSAPAPQPQGAHMPAVLAALLPALLDAVPSLIKVFGSDADSEVRKRNQAAGVAVADTLIKATNAVNLQDAVDKVTNDASAKAAAEAALAPLIVQLTEVGGGIVEARKAAALVDGDWRKVVFSFPFILALLVMPLVYMIVVGSLIKTSWLVEFTSDQRMFVWSFIIGGAFGAIIGFVYGTTIQSAKKDDIIAGRSA